MPVIATSTYENSLIVNNFNGILIKDNADSFYHALKNMSNNRNFYNSERIRSTCERYMWTNIIENDLKNYLIKLSAKV